MRLLRSSSSHYRENIEALSSHLREIAADLGLFIDSVTFDLRDLGILLDGWRRKMGYKTRGREGWLRADDVPQFLRYAW